MPDRPTEFKSSMLYWFPVVGLMVGFILAGTDRLLLWISPGAGVFSPIFLVATWLILTRGFHVDGLADTFDALGAVGDRARRLEILRDPHIGSMGTAAVVLTMIAKIWGLAAISQSGRLVAVVCSAVIARWIAVLACAVFSYARQEGLGAAFIGRAKWTHVTATSLFSIAIILYLAGHPVACLVVPLVFGLGIAFIANRSFQGITGDCLGAVIEISETAALFVFAVKP